MSTIASHPVSAAVEFIPTTTTAQVKKIRMYGVDDVRKASMALLWEAAANRLTFGLLVWGYKGSGLSAYPSYLFQSLNDARLPCSFLHIRCRHFASLIGEESKSALSQVEALFSSDGQRPMLIACDDVDLLRPGVNGVGRLYDLVSDQLLNGEPGRAVLLGVTSRPQVMPLGFVNQFGMTAHLALPDYSTARDVLRNRDVPSAWLVGKELFDGAAALDMLPTFRGLVNAADYWRTTRDEPNRDSWREVASALETACALVPESEYQAFLTTNRALLAKAKHFLDLWGKRYGSRFFGGFANSISEV